MWGNHNIHGVEPWVTDLLAAPYSATYTKRMPGREGGGDDANLHGNGWPKKISFWNFEVDENLQKNNEDVALEV